VVGVGGVVVLWWCLVVGWGVRNLWESGRPGGRFCGVGESDGKKGESNLNSSRATVSLEGERSPSAGRTFTLVPVARRGLGTNVRPCAPGEVANDRPMLGERLLPRCV
jgi:hypothetical protein